HLERVAPSLELENAGAPADADAGRRRPAVEFQRGVGLLLILSSHVRRHEWQAQARRDDQIQYRPLYHETHSSSGVPAHSVPGTPILTAEHRLHSVRGCMPPRREAVRYLWRRPLGCALSIFSTMASARCAAASARPAACSVRRAAASARVAALSAFCA